MDVNLLEKTWGEQIVAPPAVPVATVIARLEREVRSAQRRFRGAMVIAVTLLVLGWITTLAAHFTGFKAITPLTLVSQIVGSALYVALLVRARQSARAVRNEITHVGGTLRESVAATLRTVDLQIENARLAAVVIPLVVGISGWLFLARYLAGEIPGFSAALGSGGVALLGTMIGGAIWHRTRTVLVPRRRELTARLGTLA